MREYTYSSRITYGIHIMSKPLFDIQPEPPKPWYVVVFQAIGILLLVAFLGFAAVFYYLFPAQLVWLVIYLPFMFVGMMAGSRGP